jgi:hypothetical protein
MATITTLDNSLYERDFQAWLLEQASLLRAGRLDDLDVQNIAEELEGMAANNRHKIENRLVRLIQHLLKIGYQPQRRTRSWASTVFEQRRRIRQVIRSSPSLRRYPAEVLDEAYRDGRRQASVETGLPLKVFPEQCPYSIEQILDDDFLPEPVGDV